MLRIKRSEGSDSCGSNDDTQMIELLRNFFTVEDTKKKGMVCALDYIFLLEFVARIL
jgi:hypothetical protein